MGAPYIYDISRLRVKQRLITFSRGVEHECELKEVISNTSDVRYVVYCMRKRKTVAFRMSGFGLQLNSVQVNMLLIHP